MTSLAPDAPDLLQPPEVPGYRLLRPLGRGASSVVWAAAPHGSDAQVAVKLVRAGPAAQRELAVLRAVRHPHVLSLRDAVTIEGGRLALVTELLDGGTLAAVVRARGRLRPGEVVTVVAPLAQALGELHAAGIQHGDLAPGNVLFDLAGRPFLTDLGTVRLTGELRQEVFGTPGFVDPVLVSGGAAGPDSDVYGLGAISWFALCGEPPPTPMCRPPLVEAAPFAPAELVRAVQSALDPDPSSRPSPLELARALHAAAPAEPVWRPGGSPVDGGLTGRVNAQQAPPRRAERTARHREQRERRLRWPSGGRLAWLTGSTVALALAVGGAALLVPSQDSTAGPAGPTGRPAAAVASLAQTPTLAALARLADQRAGAFARAPGHCGPRSAAGVAGTVPGSPADRRDQAALAELAARCVSYRGLRLVPRELQVVTAQATQATVDVLVDRSGYDVVDSRDRVLQHVGPAAAQRSRLSVVRTDTGWLVSAVSPSPSGPPRAGSGAGR
jgi:hypothetical protein